MAKGAHFPKKFWDSPIKDNLWRLPPGHLRVYLHLAFGPTAAVSGIYRISVGAIAEDTGLDPDEVRAAINDLSDLGWCEFEHPLIWIRGTGNILDKLGTTDVRRNQKWVAATLSHLDDLPAHNPLVSAFRRHHELPDDGVVHETADSLSIGYRCPTDRVSIGPSRSMSSSSSSFSPKTPKADELAGDLGSPTGARCGGVL